MTDSKAISLLAKCVRCGQSGRVKGDAKPAWCTCVGICGPFHALPGAAACFEYMTPEQAADRDAARKITNEYIDARDAGADARWTPSGRVRSKKSAIYKTWLRRFRAAERALEALQAECAHESRSFYSRAHCARCALLIDVPQTEPGAKFLSEYSVTVTLDVSATSKIQALDGVRSCLGISASRITQIAAEER